MSESDQILHTVLHTQRRDVYGSTYVDVRVMMREGDSDSPINCTGCGMWRTPTGLEDLTIHGYISDVDNKYHILDICYRDAGTVDERRAKAMATMLAKINKAIAKAEASEHGDIYIALARAIGAKYAVELASGETARSTYSHNRWYWQSIASGRDAYRRLVAQCEREAADRHTSRVA